MAGRTILSIFDEGTSKGNSLLGDSVFSTVNKGGQQNEGIDSILKEINASFNNFFQQQRDLKSDGTDSSTTASSESTVSSETYAETIASELSSKLSESKTEEGAASTDNAVAESADSEKFDASGLAESIGITANDSIVKMLNEENRQSAEVAKATTVENKTPSTADDGLKELYSKIDAMDSTLTKNAESASTAAESTANAVSNAPSEDGGGLFSGFASMIGSTLGSLFGGKDTSQTEETPSETQTSDNVTTEAVKAEATQIVQPTATETVRVEATPSAPQPTAHDEVKVDATPIEQPSEQEEEDEVVEEEGGGWFSGLTSMIGSKIGSLFGGDESEQEPDEGGDVSAEPTSVAETVEKPVNGAQSSEQQETEIAKNEESSSFGGWFSGLTSMFGAKIDSLFGGGEGGSGAEAIPSEGGDADAMDTQNVQTAATQQSLGTPQLPVEPTVLEKPTAAKSEPMSNRLGASNEGQSANGELSAKIDEMRASIVASIESLAESQKSSTESLIAAIGGVSQQGAPQSEGNTVVVSQPAPSAPAERVGRIGI